MLIRDSLIATRRAIRYPDSDDEPEIGSARCSKSSRRYKTMHHVHSCLDQIKYELMKTCIRLGQR